MKRIQFLVLCLLSVWLMARPGIVSGAPQATDLNVARLGVNEEGDELLAVHKRPIRYLTQQGLLAPIDTSLQPTADGYLNETNTLRTSFTAQYTRGWDVGLEGASVRIEPVSMGRVVDGFFVDYAYPSEQARVTTGHEANTLVYPQTYPGVNDAFVVRRGELEHLQQLETPESVPAGQGAPAFLYKLSVSSDITLEFRPLAISDGVASLPHFLLKAPDGRTLASIPTPHYWDSSAPAIHAVGDFSWDPVSDSEGYLAVKLSDEILGQMTYPVTVDPNIQQYLDPLNGSAASTGSAWGHVDLGGGSTLAIRFNGNWFQIGAVWADLGPPYDVQIIVDCVATPVFDLAGNIDGKVKKAEISYSVVTDTYGDQELVEINDHKTDALDDTLSFPLFANNIADGRNAESFAGATPDFSKDKTYVKAPKQASSKNAFTNHSSYKLKGKAVKDMNNSLKGEVSTPSDYPLPAGYFALAFHDTSIYNMELSIRIDDIVLMVEYRPND